MNKTLSTLVSDEDTLNAELSAKQAQLTSLNKDLEDLKAKKDRVTKQVRTYNKATTQEPVPTNVAVTNDVHVLNFSDI